MGKEPLDYAPIDKMLREQAKAKLDRKRYKFNAQIAKECGCSNSAVEKRKKVLAHAAIVIEQEEIARNDQRRPKGTRGNASPWLDALQREASGDPEAFFKMIEDEPILSPDQSMRIMSAMSRDPRVPPQVRTSADKRLDELRVRHAPKESLGPGPPLDDEDKVKRLAAILQACPDEVIEKAMATLAPAESSDGEKIEGPVQFYQSMEADSPKLLIEAPDEDPK